MTVLSKCFRHTIYSGKFNHFQQTSRLEVINSNLAGYIPVIIQPAIFRFSSFPRSFIGNLAYIQIPALSYWDDKIKTCRLNGHRYIPELLEDTTFLFPSLLRSYRVKLSTSLSIFRTSYKLLG